MKVDVEEFLRGRSLDGEELQLWRTYAQHLLAVAGDELLRPRHLEQAVQAVVDAGRPPDVARLLQRVGEALLAHLRAQEQAAAREQATAPPVQVPAAAGSALPPAPRSRVVPPPAASQAGSRALLYGLAAVGVIAIGAGVLWLLSGDDDKPPWADRPDGAVAAATAKPAPPAPAGAGDILKINESNPGQAMAMEHVIARGKLTIVEFYSDQCPACRAMERPLRDLAARRSDLAIRQLNIDRPGAYGIDFASPLAQVHRVRATPSFVIFAASGEQIADGQKAKRMVRGWYDEVSDRRAY